MRSIEEKQETFKLPKFEPKAAARETPNFRVVMDWKPGLEDQKGGERFFIEPKNETAAKMLELAAQAHQIHNFNLRSTVIEGDIKEMPALRADFIEGNLPSLMQGVTEIPEEGGDTVPSPDRMEECLRLHPNSYTFSEE